MSSANRSKSRPRLSVAMDVDPRDNEETLAEPTQTVDSSNITQEASLVASQEGAPEKEGAKPAQVQTQDPAIQEINGRIYVLVGDDLMPEGARVQMTVALTAIERHRWLQYAEQHDLTIVEVLRRAMSKLLE